MANLAKPRMAWPVLAALLAAAFLGCASKAQLRPKVQNHPSQFPHSLNFKGLAIAVVPFDGLRDVYSAPGDSKAAKPDFDWLKAGVRPTRIILANEAQEAFFLDPSQITCVDDQGVVYQAYGPREAGDAVVASEAFRAHLKRGLRGALVGGALGAGVGAALGAAISGYYRGYRGSGAAQGAAVGGILGGVQGLFVGAATGRADLERRVRGLIDTQQLPETILSPGMTQEGLVFFPAKPFRAVRLVVADAARQAAWIVEIEVALPRMPPPPLQTTPSRGEGGKP